MTRTAAHDRFLTREGAFYRSFFSLTAMIALQNLVTLSVNLLDSLMLLAYSEEAMAGSTLVNSIQFLLQMVVMGVGESIVILGAQYWGRAKSGQEPERALAAIRRIQSFGLLIASTAGLLIWAASFFFPRLCLGLLTDDAVIIGEAARYLRIVCFSYVFFAVTNVLLATLRSVETVFIGFVVSISTLCVNGLLNTLLIFGCGPFPRLGARGAAIATLAARVLETVIVVGYMLAVDKKLRVRVRDFFRTSRPLAADFLRTGGLVILSNLMWGVAMWVQTAILGHLRGQGAAAVTANGIATTVFQIVTVISYGAASASAVIIGKTIGEGHLKRLRTYTRTMQVLFIGIGLVTGTALFFLKDLLLGFYSRDMSPEAHRLTLQFLTVLSVTVVGTSYQVACLTGIVRGGGDTRFVLFNDALFMWVVVIPSALLAAYVFGAPPVVVFICLKSDQILKCLVAAVKVNRFGWVRRLARD